MCKDPAATQCLPCQEGAGPSDTGLTLKEAVQELYEESRRMRDLQQEIAKWYTTLLLAILASFPLLMKELAPQAKNGAGSAVTTAAPKAAAAAPASGAQPATSVASGPLAAASPASAASAAPDGTSGLAINAKAIAGGWAVVSVVLTVLVILHLIRLNWRFRQMQHVLKKNDPLTQHWDELRNTQNGKVDKLMARWLLPHRLTCISLAVVGIGAPLALYWVMFGTN